MLYLVSFSLIGFNSLLCDGPSIRRPKVIVCDPDVCCVNNQSDAEPSLYEDRREQAGCIRPVLQLLVLRDIGGRRHMPMAMLELVTFR